MRDKIEEVKKSAIVFAVFAVLILGCAFYLFNLVLDVNATLSYRFCNIFILTTSGILIGKAWRLACIYTELKEELAKNVEHEADDGESNARQTYGNTKDKMPPNNS